VRAARQDRRGASARKLEPLCPKGQPGLATATPGCPALGPGSGGDFADYRGAEAPIAEPGAAVGRFSARSLFPDSSQSTEKGGEGVEALLGGVGEEIVGDSDPGSYRPAAVSGTGCQVLPPSWVMSSVAPWRLGPA